MSPNEILPAKIFKKEGDNMAGRRGQPIDILVAKGKKHLAKNEIKHRKEHEIKLGSKELLCPAYVKNDVAAFSKWREIKHLYSNVDFISSSDTGMIARYCVTYSEYLNLRERMKRINNIHDDGDNLENYIEDSDEFDNRIKKQLMDMISTDAILRLETAINKKQDLLVKMEDRMFLNPLARVRNVPKKEPEKVDPLKDKGFGNV
jgi:phage terminase small subunit